MTTHPFTFKTDESLNKAHNLFLKIVDMLNQANIPYFQEEDNDLLPWNHDIDSSVNRDICVRVLKLNGILFD